MSIVYGLIVILVALSTGLLAFLMARSPLLLILSTLMSEDACAAFYRLIVSGIPVIAVLTGVGVFRSDYLYRNWSPLSTYFPIPIPLPSSTSEWFVLIYNTTAASSAGVYSWLAIVVFVCLVQHVGLSRARIMAGKE